MEKVKAFWGALPKTLKVFVYIVVSIILSEGLIELGNLEQGFIVRVLAQIVNLSIVFLEEAIPEVRKRMSE